MKWNELECSIVLVVFVVVFCVVAVSFFDVAYLFLYLCAWQQTSVLTYTHKHTHRQQTEEYYKYSELI